MRCPYCKSPLTENSSECPSCKLTLSRASALLGPVPLFGHTLAEMARLLNKGEVKQLQTLLDKVKRRFPQINIHTLIREFPENHPFDLYLFWIFNNAGLSEEAHKGGENRDILIAVDPAQTRVGMIVGYGLEPFLRDEALDHILAKAEPLFRQQKWLDGFVSIIKDLDQLLEVTAIELADALGIQTKQFDATLSGDY